MAGSINKVILLGRLGADPEIRMSQDGKKIAKFSLATSESWKDKQSGEKKEKTEWHKVIIFSSGLADITEKYLKKGSLIYIEGQISTRKYTDQSGIEKYITEIVLQGYNCQLTMIDNRSENSENLSSPSIDNTLDKKESVDDSLQGIDIDDEVPF
ncbi:MAG: single-stranded DNA-binding protein [alpha proteobacterium MED-G10]|nr:single-stranded DNA-binding protein [Rickettsiales bacterium]PDH56820.1 MAG: single-stranded DNA-binding protein [alpha proteobacterium MED-G10]|tara:strand:+ start:573 stop:1037 length:465 start_codon:yes stop_codon:yes gene_type:complete